MRANVFVLRTSYKTELQLRLAAKKAITRFYNFTSHCFIILLYWLTNFTDINSNYEILNFVTLMY